MKQSPQITDIMSAAIPALLWPLILAAGLVLLAPSSPAQTAFIHDSSGNLTNVVSNSSASPTGIVPAIGQTISLGDPLSLSVAGSGSGVLTYQWRLNGNNISGATSATYFLGSASATDSGIYTVVITSSGGSVTNQIGTISVFPTTNSLYGIAYGSGKYIAVGDKGAIATSTDSYIWTLASSGTTNRLEALAFQGGKFVVVGEKGTILTSTNGTQWFQVTSNNTNDFKGIAFGNGTYVVVGAKGTTLTSPDAIAWTTRSYDNPTLNGVAFAAGRFVLVGTSGSIWHSTNGASWLVRDWPTNVVLNAITYANSNYIAVGAKGVILTSADANAWTQRAVTTSQDFESVVRFTDAFSEYVIAIGPPGAAFHSPNGTLWAASDSSTFEFLYGCVASNSLAVAVGRNGTIVRIPYWKTHHFEWASISSPQLVGQSFPVTVMAKDAADNLIYNNSGSASISAFSLAAASSNVLIGNVTHSVYATGTTNNNYTAGFSFTPSSELTVTHVRHYFGAKVSFWDDTRNLLAQLNVTNAPGSWISTPLPHPLVLKAGKTYIVASYSQAGYYFRLDGSNTFSDGVLNQALIATVDTFPEIPYLAFWPLVDFSYSVRKTQQVSCSPSNIIFNGTMTQTNVTVNAAGDIIVLRVTDAAGHEGTSTPFSVYAGNTVGIVASASPNPASYQAPLVYSATIGNSGPLAVTNVYVTDVLPLGVTYVSASSSAGGCTVNGRLVECWIGNLTNRETAWISITVTPSVAGVVLTNTLILNCDYHNRYPLYGTVEQLTYVPPRLFVNNANVQEGNLGLAYFLYPVTLSSPSPLTARFSVSTLPATAVENADYAGMTDQVFAVGPGSTNGYVIFGVQGDTIQESNETFVLKFSNPVNASLTTTQATITIFNDDGIAGNLSSLSWNTLFSPKRINSAFAITNIARDSSNNIATNFSGNVLWRVANLSSSTNILLTNDIHFASDNLGTYTLGYQFSVTTNLFVTHVRHYFGSKVSIWNDGGLLLASANVQGTPGEWSETQLSTPVFIQTNRFYRIGVYTAGEGYFWNIDSPSISKYGRIYGSLYSSGDTFPEITDAARWYMVDWRCALPGTVSPSVSGNFSSGVLNTNLSLAESGTIYMMADDTNGHAGFSIPVMVLESNDLALLVQYSPSPALVNTNLTLSISVMNSGPNSSSGIKLTNWLPANASFVSATAAQGTVTQTNGIVSWSLTSLASLNNATLTVVLAPTVAGLPLTNLTRVVRTESESNTNNNTVSLVVIPDFSINSQMASGSDFSGSSWRSAGTKLWFTQTNTTHDGIDALQSGSIAHSQQSWTETTVRGPGRLSFWWKVSSESGGDTLSFTANGTTQASISGSIDWQERIYNLAAGLYTLRWTYAKDASINAGTDAGWLDQMVYTVPPFFFTNSFYSNSQFRTTLTGTNSQRLILQGSPDLIRWTSFSTNTMPGLTTNLIINPPTNAPLRFYRAIHRND